MTFRVYKKDMIKSYVWQILDFFRNLLFLYPVSGKNHLINYNNLNRCSNLV